jgi:hypothetical protein
MDFLNSFALHLIEMINERIEAGRPDVSIGFEPLVEFPEPLGPQSVDPPLGVRSRGHEPVGPEYSEVLRNRRLAERKFVHQFTHGPIPGLQRRQDRPSVGFGENCERVHPPIILARAYTRQGIYTVDG